MTVPTKPVSTTASLLMLGGEDIDRAFSWSEAVEALRAAYAAAAPQMFPPRTMARGDGLWLRTLSGIAPDGGVMGAKMIAVNLKRHLASYLIPLFDQQTTELVALLDGNAITGYRTAATTALAVDTLTRPGAVDVGVLGTGFEARNHVRALATVRPIASVTVFSPSAESRAAFAREMSALEFPINAVDTARRVVEAGPDVLICAARARGEQPLFDGKWLKSGVTVASIGSTLPEQREIDVETIDRADVIVADMVEEVTDDTGDMRAARDAGVSFNEKIVALADLVAGHHAGRRSADDVVLYKSVGSGIQDITVAAMCLTRARALGLGTALPSTIRPIVK